MSIPLIISGSLKIKDACPSHRKINKEEKTLKTSMIKMKVERLHKLSRTKYLVFDMPVQRKEDIWDKIRQSRMVRSAIINWPTSSLTASKEDRSFNFLDGKQRVTTLLRFIDNKFVLDKTMLPVNGVEIAGKKFSELPQDMRNSILNYSLDIVQIEDATMEEKEELFYLLNFGVPLKKIETTRAMLGGKSLKLVEEVANTPFFQSKAAISKSSKKHYLDQELVLQILILIQKENTGFGGIELENFAKELKSERVQAEVTSKMQNASFYLNQAFPKKEKFLKKLHIPMLFKLVLEIQENAVVIPHDEFEKWANLFFVSVPSEYSNSSQSGSAKSGNVQTRMHSMRNHFQHYFRDRITAKKLESQNNIQETAS
jgi:hypothetical protein